MNEKHAFSISAPICLLTSATTKNSSFQILKNISEKKFIFFTIRNRILPFETGTFNISFIILNLHECN